MCQIFVGKICVYSHSVNGRLIYIGKGTSSRSHDSKIRTPLWKSLVDESFDVEILRWFESNSEALRFERERIREFRPPANVTHVRGKEREIASRSKERARYLKQPPRANNPPIPWLGGHGGSRVGSGRPRSKERCHCGEHTMARAMASRLRCRKTVKNKP